jgi:hypothetical protein
MRQYQNCLDSFDKANLDALRWHMVCKACPSEQEQGMQANQHFLRSVSAADNTGEL